MKSVSSFGVTVLLYALVLPLRGATPRIQGLGDLPGGSFGSEANGVSGLGRRRRLRQRGGGGRFTLADDD